MTPEERIRELAKKSNIRAADAARLLAAVKNEPLPLDRRFDPFTRISALTGMLVGLAASACAVAVCRLGVRFDGFLDVHAVKHDVTWREALLDQVAAFLLPAIIFWGIGYAFARRGRAVDMFSTIGLARLPPLVLTLPIAVVGDGVKNGNTLSILGWLLVGLLLIGTALQIYLLVVGFRTATGLVASRLAVAVVAAIISAEIASKVFLALV